jgi:hypothetical protein
MIKSQSEFLKKATLILQIDTTTDKSVAWDFIDRHIDESWDWRRLSLQDLISWKFVGKHIDKPWDWTFLSCRDSLTIDVIKQHTEWPWDWKKFSYRCDITWDFIKEHTYKPWDWSYLSRHYKSFSLTLVDLIKVVFKHSDKTWDWEFVGRNLSRPYMFAILDILSDKAWDWDYLSRMDIPFPIVNKLSDKPWDWSRIVDRQTKELEDRAARLIQNAWKTCNHDYRYNVCKKKINTWATEDDEPLKKQARFE